MTGGHVDDLIEEYALGLLEAEEAARVEAHAAACARCRAQLESAERAVSLLAALAEPVEPSPQAAERLFGRVRRARASRRAARPPATGPARWAAGRLWPAAAGLSLILALVLGAWNIALQAQLRQVVAQNQALAERLTRQERRVALVSSAQVAVVEMSGTEDAPQSKGRAYMDQATGTVWVTVSGLPAVDDAWTYQLWLIGADGPESAGFLALADDGRREVWLNDVEGLGEYQAVGVSLEQAGGSAAPTRVVTVGGF